MSFKTKFLLYLQYFLGRLSIFIIGPLTYILMKLMGYRIRDIDKVRRDVKLLFDKYKGPWIICPNHLTMIDSVILAYAMVPLHRYLFKYGLLAWNLPEQENFQRNIFLTAVCYLTKCIPVHRGGDRDQMKATLEKCSYLLERKDKILIFPEGGRSRTNRVDTENFSYGVGRFVNNVPNCHVMCVYLRGDRQDTYSNLPRFREKFTMSIGTCLPHSEYKGLKAHRDSAQQIVSQLARMEEDYFETRRKRYS